MFKIAIDNGHGRNTPGKRTPIFPGTNSFIHEWEFNHPTSKKLDEILKQLGFSVLLVSDTEEDTALKERTDKANLFNADLFISIHFNALTGKWGTQSGIETYHYPTSSKGKKVAEYIQKNLIENTSRKNRGVKGANFFVLRETKMPSVLVECGFMDNLAEAKLMLNEDYQMKCAESIAMGICEYFGVDYKTRSDWDSKPLDAFVTKGELLQFLGIEEETKSTGYKTIRKYDTNIHVYELSDDEFLDVDLGERFKLERLSTIMKNKIKAGEKVVAGINGGFFNFNGSSEHLGLYIDEGLYYTQPSGNFVDFIYYKDGKVEIRNMQGYDQKELSRLQAEAHWAIGTSYSLIQNGKVNLENSSKFSHSTVRNPRTMFGHKGKNFILAVADGRTSNSRGLTANQQAQVMLELGCTSAVNMDGGGSSTMAVTENGVVKVKNKPSGGTERAVGSVMLVKRV